MSVFNVKIYVCDFCGKITLGTINDEVVNRTSNWQSGVVDIPTVEKSKEYDFCPECIDAKVTDMGLISDYDKVKYHVFKKLNDGMEMSDHFLETQRTAAKLDKSEQRVASGQVWEDVETGDTFKITEIHDGQAKDNKGGKTSVVALKELDRYELVEGTTC